MPWPGIWNSAQINHFPPTSIPQPSGARTRSNPYMRRLDLALPFNRVAGTFASFSVRTRIVVLALIPVRGFLDNGVTYTAGERDVGRAFHHAFHCRVRRPP